jgi:hypothetical protein
MSLLGEVTLPVGDEGVSDGVVTWKGLGLVGMTLNERWALTGNIGPRVSPAQEPSEGARDVDLIYTAALTRSVSSTLSLFAEVFGDMSIAGQRGDHHHLQTGLTALAGTRAQWDVRLGVGGGAGALVWTFGVGLSARFPR